MSSAAKSVDLQPLTVGAYAVRHRQPLDPLFAEDLDTLHKVIAIQWISTWQPTHHEQAERVRAALLAENWSDAVVEWMSSTGEVVDVYPHGVEIHRASDVPDEEFGLRIQTSPLFDA